MTTIKAAVARAFNEAMTIEDVVLRAPRAGEVQVAIEAVAICGSDVSYLDGGFPIALPAVFGHEAAGRITALGHGVKGLNLGDPVVVTLIKSCGTCPSCQSAHPAICEAPSGDDTPLALPDGTPLAQGLDVGGFAEAVVVDQSQVVRIPDFVPMASASLLACGVITGVGSAVNVARINPGENVAVIGAGGVGLNAIQGARIAGAGKIIAIDRARRSWTLRAISAPPTVCSPPSRSPGTRCARSPAGAAWRWRWSPLARPRSTTARRATSPRVAGW